MSFVIGWHFSFSASTNLFKLPGPQFLHLKPNWWKVSDIYHNKVKVKLLSRVRLFATPWTVAHQAPPSMGFSKQEYWSGLPFPSPGDFPDPGIEPKSPALQAVSCLSGGFFTDWATRKALHVVKSIYLSIHTHICMSIISGCVLSHCSPVGSSVHGDSPGKNTGVGCHALLQGIFPTQGLNPGLPHCRWIL